MSGGRFHVDIETVRRFDRPGPRYTSYPTAVEFHDGVGEDAYRKKLAEADAAGSAEPLSLYAHLPFCEHRCLFCGCHVVITPHMPVAEKYMAYVKEEIDRVAGLLPQPAPGGPDALGRGNAHLLQPGPARGSLRALTGGTSISTQGPKLPSRSTPG